MRTRLYMDASALVKRYMAEPGTGRVLDLLREAERIFISKVAYAELLMTFRRKREEGLLSKKDFSSLCRTLDRDWSGFLLVEVSDEVMEIIRRRCLRHPLRALDAIHLSSALWVKNLVKGPIGMVCSDRRLTHAAQREGLVVIDPIGD